VFIYFHDFTTYLTRSKHVLYHNTTGFAGVTDMPLFVFAIMFCLVGHGEYIWL